MVELQWFTLSPHSKKDLHSDLLLCWDISVDSACTSCAFLGFLCMLWFPHTVQRCQVNRCLLDWMWECVRTSVSMLALWWTAPRLHIQQTSKWFVQSKKCYSYIFLKFNSKRWTFIKCSLRPCVAYGELFWGLFCLNFDDHSSRKSETSN